MINSAKISWQWRIGSERITRHRLPRLKEWGQWIFEEPILALCDFNRRWRAIVMAMIGGLRAAVSVILALAGWS